MKLSGITKNPNQGTYAFTMRTGFEKFGSFFSRMMFWGSIGPEFGVWCVLESYWMNSNRFLSLAEPVDHNLTLRTVFRTWILGKFAGA